MKYHITDEMWDCEDPLDPQAHKSLCFDLRWLLLFQCVFLLLRLPVHHLDSASATAYFIIGPHSRLGNDFWTEMHHLGIHEYLDLISFLGHTRALSKPTETATLPEGYTAFLSSLCCVPALPRASLGQSHTGAQGTTFKGVQVQSRPRSQFLFKREGERRPSWKNLKRYSLWDVDLRLLEPESRCLLMLGPECLWSPGPRR